MATETKMSIFRARDIGMMAEERGFEPTPDATTEGLTRMFEAGMTSGAVVKRLFDAPGFSLVYAWFKPDFPLLRHSHDKDCLYYIVAGSLKLGTEELGPRDSFFVPADVPYTYKPGPEGVEVLEIRQANHFNFVNHAKGEAWWEKAAGEIAIHRESWKTATRPKLNA